MIIRRSTDHAFTLMEVLIAVVAVSIVLSAITSVFFGALRLQHTTQESLARSHPALHALAMIKRDLANLVPPGSNSLAGSLQQTTTSSSIDGQNTPDLYTTTGIVSERAPWSEIQKVRYLLVQSTNTPGSKDLIRSVTRNLLATDDEDIAYQWLMADVDQIAFQFYDGTAWRDSWDPTSEDVPMPKGIRVQLALHNTNSNEVLPPLELVMPILVQARTNQTEEATQ